MIDDVINKLKQVLKQKYQGVIKREVLQTIVYGIQQPPLVDIINEEYQEALQSSLKDASEEKKEDFLFNLYLAGAESLCNNPASVAAIEKAAVEAKIEYDRQRFGSSSR